MASVRSKELDPYDAPNRARALNTAPTLRSPGDCAGLTRSAEEADLAAIVNLCRLMTKHQVSSVFSFLPFKDLAF